MENRTFSIMLFAERGFLQDDICEWVDSSLALTDAYKTLAVTYSSTRELIYGQIRAAGDISDFDIKEFLALIPKGLEVLNFVEAGSIDKAYNTFIAGDYCSAC